MYLCEYLFLIPLLLFMGDDVVDVWFFTIGKPCYKHLFGVKGFCVVGAVRVVTCVVVCNCYHSMYCWWVSVLEFQ